MFDHRGPLVLFCGILALCSPVSPAKIDRALVQKTPDAVARGGHKQVKTKNETYRNGTAQSVTPLLSSGVKLFHS